MVLAQAKETNVLLMIPDDLRIVGDTDTRKMQTVSDETLMRLQIHNPRRYCDLTRALIPQAAAVCVSELSQQRSER